MSDAYKQVPLSDEAFDLDSYLAVFDPGASSPKIFKQRVLPFGSVASVTAFLRVLGVQLDLRQSGSGICFVTNTAERVEELVAEIDEAIKSNLLPRRDGEKLRGRLQFASSQMFGRRFRRLLKVLSNHVTAGRQTLSSRTHECLAEIRSLLLKNVPRN